MAAVKASCKRCFYDSVVDTLLHGCHTTVDFSRHPALQSAVSLLAAKLHVLTVEWEKEHVRSRPPLMSNSELMSGRLLVGCHRGRRGPFVCQRLIWWTHSFSS